MIAYRVGASAEKILAVQIDLAGVVTPVLRVRDSTGSLIDVSPPMSRFHFPTPGKFTVRVPFGDSGTVEILPGTHYSGSGHTLIPLGADHPVFESELAPSVGAPGSGTQGCSIEFAVEPRGLRWRAANLAGDVSLDDSCPVVTVTLRLADENDGEILFPKCALNSFRAERSAFPPE